MGRTKRARRQLNPSPVIASPDSAWLRRNRPWLAALLLAWIAFLYAPSLENGFTYDDPSIVNDASDLLSNPRLAARLFSPDYFRLSGESTFRPIVTLTYMVDWQIGGGKAWAFHLHSVLWHLLTVGCLIVLLPRLGAGPFAQFAVAAIYGVHPALTEAVDAIAFREDVLVVAFGLLGLLTMTGSWPRAVAVRIVVGTLFFAAALLSKESGLVFVVLLPLTHWAIARHATPADSWHASRHVLQYVSLSLCVLAYLVVRFWFLPASESYGVRVSESLAYSVATGIVAVGYYLLLFIYPHPLCADYRGVVAYVASVIDWRIWASLAVIGGVTGLVWWQRRTRPLAFWGWAWFLMSLAPVSNIIPIPTFMAERFLYMPYVGLVVFAVTLLVRLVALPSRTLMMATIVLLCMFSGLTWTRQRAWASNEVLWQTTLEDHPSAHGALHGYGSALIESGRYIEAITYLKRVLEASDIGADRRAVVARELGFAHISLGQVREGITSFEDSLAAAPTSMAHQNLAVVLLRLDRLGEAEQHMRAAIQLQPDEPEAHSGLGAVLARQGRMADAIAAYREGIRLRPSLASAHANLGVALASEGQPDQAIESLLQAIAIDPDQSRWRYRVATLLHERGRTNEAIQQLDAALGVDPGYGEARDLLTQLSNR
jgi:protein O-mannosyl-transferase